MPADLPESVDAWRMVSARRCFEGTLPLAAMSRLLPSLAGDSGECRYRLEFGRDPLGFARLDLTLDAELELLCQRSLEPFRFPLSIRQSLGLIGDESQEAALPGGIEPALVPEDGVLHPRELVEDELILALPVVPVRPDSEPVEADFGEGQPEEEPATNPFAALAALKQGSH